MSNYDVADELVCVTFEVSSVLECAGLAIDFCLFDIPGRLELFGAAIGGVFDLALHRFGKLEQMKRKKSERPLDRFPYSEIGVSYFAEQAYCEKRVELWLQNPTTSGLVSVPAALEGLPEAQNQEDLVTSGKEFHEAVESASTPLSSSEIAQAVQLGRSFALAESRLTGEYRGVRLRGRPDHVFFDGRHASCVLE